MTGIDPWPTPLEALFRERRESFVRTATMILGNRAEAEEVVHDAFVATARRWTSVTDAPAYVRRAVVNGCHGVLRRRRIRERHPVDPPPDDAPVQLVELRDVLLGLPVRQRTVLVLRYVDGADDEQIAGLLGCRRATVRSLAARGLASIRKELT